jgi:hypothetical protein
LLDEALGCEIPGGLLSESRWSGEEKRLGREKRTRRCEEKNGGGRGI